METQNGKSRRKEVWPPQHGPSEQRIKIIFSAGKKLILVGREGKNEAGVGGEGSNMRRSQRIPSTRESPQKKRPRQRLMDENFQKNTTPRTMGGRNVRGRVQKDTRQTKGGGDTLQHGMPRKV